MTRCRNWQVRKSRGTQDEEPNLTLDESHQPFLDFAEQILPQSVSRAAITGASALGGNRCRANVAGTGTSAAAGGRQRP
ncbi:hypothetical protein CWS02_16805 [Enterobacter sp. EA-1]|nr:hypothetical protein CWS02_16805 [Enterobacter sp. EA-1]